MKDTNIEWCDSTMNFWEGCTKVGPGCDNCYAEKRNARFGGGQAVNWGSGAPRRRTSVANWNNPSKWNKEHAAFFAEHGRRRRVFCASLADVFDNEVDQRWRDEAFKVMENTPNLDWLVLTKRIGNVRKMVPAAWLELGGWPSHIRIGATIVNQEEADRDIPKLLALPCPNFLSMEPLRGDVDLTAIPISGSGHHEFDPIVVANLLKRAEQYPPLPRIEWVIVGGETKTGARPMHPAWVKSLRDQCAEAGVPFLFKQWGHWASTVPAAYPEPELWVNKADGATAFDGDQRLEVGEWSGVWRIGKARAGRHLDCRTHDGFPS